MILRIEFQFNAAHRLPFYNGPCSRTHGHNYKLLVFVKGSVNPKTGISLDFVKCKEIVQDQVIRKIDHNDLNQIIQNPTAENLVMWIWQQLLLKLPGLYELQLYETEDSAVIYRGNTEVTA